ncbi:hypothetical protein [Steroidobacter sp.]|uniref:hypothetical protein n=1 Tax=Steroidobacter sp. TaxID=1978227 RepID=UPI001A383B45|nr:hypothetical protein [Steroidobacter sp.]MBL8267750.1 hypothetical protein [Steroidobacter sp.]
MAPDEPIAPRPATASLAELIEFERGELMQTHAMARCLKDVLTYSDDDDATLHADVALVISRLINGSVARLEDVRVRVAKLESSVNYSLDSGPPPPREVREPRATYM